MLVLGGPPFGESIVMWWNFVGRSHEEIVAFREEWQGQIDGERLVDGRFGIPVDDPSPPIPAPLCPTPGSRSGTDRAAPLVGGLHAGSAGRLGPCRGVGASAGCPHGTGDR